MDFFPGGRVLSYGTAARRMNSDGTVTNEVGEFELGHLMAGVTNYLTFGALTSNETHYVPIDPLQPGEVRDLGAITPVVLTEKRP